MIKRSNLISNHKSNYHNYYETSSLCISRQINRVQSTIISNEVPEVAVVSPISGCVFERRLIEKFIADNGTDPINGETLTVEQLVELKISPLIKPKPPTATSIPAILKSLQDEWDATMLHSSTLRQQLQTARQELSHALYQHDAACRVIARLTKEVTAAREALATLKPQSNIVDGQQMHAAYAAEVTNDIDQNISETGMPDEVLSKLQEKATMLTTERKKRGKSIPEGLTSAEIIQTFDQIASHVGLHSAGTPGILTMDICPMDSSKIVTGGVDKTAVVFDKSSEQVIANLQGHTKRINSVVYHSKEDIVITGSQDSSIRIWNVSGDTQSSLCQHIMKLHDASITGLSLHATGDYILSSSNDGTWAFSDLHVGKPLFKVNGKAGSGLTCAQLHPDGLILGTGTESATVKIWDLKERTNVANFEAHSVAISSISFSENGYYLATSAHDNVVKLWDLRKLKNFKTITLEDDFEVKSVTFDQSGTYLAIAGGDVKIYQCKQWVPLKTFKHHTSIATAVKFGKNASYIASTSMDRSLKIYGI